MAASSRTVDPVSLRRILVRAPNWLGDLCMTLPAVEALAAAAPKATFVLACKPSLESLARRVPRVSQVIVLDQVPGVRGALVHRRAIREARCDAAVVVPRSLRALLPVAAARIPIRVGFAGNGRSPLLSHPVRGWKPLRLAHRLDYFGALLGPFGLAAPSSGWRYTPRPEEIEWQNAGLRTHPARRPGARLVALEPGGSYGVAKRWPEARYAALVRRLREDGVDVLVIGTKEMEPLQDRILAASGVPLIRGAGMTTLPALAATLAQVDALVTNDTGPMHLAAAVGTPILALFGSTDPAVCGPRGVGRAKVLYQKVDCAPCYLKECPVPGHPCLDQFHVERVHHEVMTLLAGGGSRG